MKMRPVHLLVPVLGIALAVLSPFEKPRMPVKHKKGRGAAPAQAVAVGKWNDAAFLRDRMHVACVRAKEAVKMHYVKEPGARAAGVDEAAGVLREDLDAAFRRLGAADDAAVAAMARDLAGQVLAVYDPRAQEVLVLPANAQAAAAAAGDPSLADDPAVLRLVLVRAAVIALDRQILTEWKAALDAALSIDAVQCAGAVLEGHAQYETERVAQRWVATEEDFPSNTFERLVRLLTAPPPADAPQSVKALADEAGFAILKGHAFISAVAKRKTPGVRGVLQAPPTDRKAIFDPEAYLASFTKAAQPATDPAYKELAVLTPPDSGWQVEEAAQEAAQVEAWLDPLPRSLWAGEVAAFKRGRVWTATHPDGGVHTRTTIMEFGTGGLASSYVALARSAAEKSGSQVQAGAGRDGGLPGFSAQRTKDGLDERTQMTSEGRFVVVVITDDGQTTRDRIDDALEAAAEVLAKQEKTRTNRRDK